jgi:hypothetical protein
VLLPPAIILLVFAMVVIAIGGFAFVGGQQSMLGALRLKSDAMREAVITLDKRCARCARRRSTASQASRRPSTSWRRIGARRRR